MTYRKVKNPRFTASLAELELQDAMLKQFDLSVEELDQRIDRLERDGVYSAEVAEGAREEVAKVVLDFNLLVISKVELFDRLSADERTSR